MEAKEHVVKYFPDVNDSIWNKTILIISDINRPRFAKLVKNQIAKVLTEVPQIYEEIQECHTLRELVISWRKAKWKGERSKDGNRRRKLFEVIRWTKHHDDVLGAMTGLLPDEQLDDVNPLPLDIAKLHVADFIENYDLWEACLEIFEIFECKKNKYCDYE